MPSELFHFTCAHQAPKIARDGFVRPVVELVPRFRKVPPWGRYAWFTDLATPVRGALGLTSQLATCDRTERRFRVTEGVEIVEWMSVRLTFDWAWILEDAPEARPRHWYLSAAPVPVIEAPRVH